MVPWSRRELLLAGGGVAAATSLAGCTGALPFGGTERDVELTAVRSWTPAPAATESVREHYSVTAVDVDGLHRRAPERYVDAVAREADGVLRYFDVEPSSVETSVSIEYGAVVLRVDHDADGVADRLSDEGFERGPDDGGFVRFERGPRTDRGGTSLAFDGTFVVQTPRGGSVRLAVLLDAYDGPGTRYVDASDVFARLLRAAPAADRLTLQAHEEPIPDADADPSYAQFGGLLGTAGGISFTDARVSQRTAFLFADAGDVDRDAIGEYVETRTGGDSPDGLRTDVTVNGRVARVSTSAPRDEVFASETTA